MRVLVCDDSAFMRKSIRQMLESDPDIEVVAVAHNGKQAVELAKRHEPDVITLDIEMPEMNGLEALKVIMRECPTHVVMISSLTTQGSHESFEALRAGAADVFAKDHATVSHTITDMREDLVRRVRALAASRKPRPRLGAVTPASPSGTKPPARPARPAAPRKPLDLPKGFADLVVIGSSTGGPPVVERVLTRVPAGCKPAIVVAQHMPRMFTESMADRLNRACAVPVHHLRPGMTVEPGNIYICPGGENTHLRRTAAGAISVRINTEPASTVYFPSVDVLFSTAADCTGPRTLGIVLTGMGEDGGEGAVKLKNAGGKVVAQDEQSCVVYGMPKAAVTRNATVGTANPNEIAETLAMVCSPAAAAA